MIYLYSIKTEVKLLKIIAFRVSIFYAEFVGFFQLKFQTSAQTIVMSDCMI